MKRIFYFLFVAGAAYMLYSAYKKAQPVVSTETPLPQGAQFTGRQQVTTTGRPPNFPQTEVVGYAVHNWAEYVLPDGRTDWVAVKG